MKTYNVVLVGLLALLSTSSPAIARGHGGKSSGHISGYRYTARMSYPNIGHAYRSHSYYGSFTTYSRHPNTRKAYGVRRDARGHIARSPEAKYAFKRLHPCPSTGRSSGRCPGYVIDHVRALKRGGLDAPANMQWQTKQAAKEKDRTE